MRISVIRDNQFVELTEAQQKIINSIGRKEERQVKAKEAQPFRFNRRQTISLPVWREYK